MKKFLIIALAVISLFALTACGGEEVSIDTAALISELEGSTVFVDQFQPQDEVALSALVKLDTSLISEFTYAVGTGYTGEEYGVFLCNSKADAETIKAQLDAHVESQYALYESYAVDALPRISNAVIMQKGSYVCIVCAEDYDGARAIVEKYFG